MFPKCKSYQKEISSFQQPTLFIDLHDHYELVLLVAGESEKTSIEAPSNSSLLVVKAYILYKPPRQMALDDDLPWPKPHGNAAKISPGKILPSFLPFQSDQNQKSLVKFHIKSPFLLA